MDVKRVIPGLVKNQPDAGNFCILPYPQFSKGELEALAATATVRNNYQLNR